MSRTTGPRCQLPGAIRLSASLWTGEFGEQLFLLLQQFAHLPGRRRVVGEDLGRCITQNKLHAEHDKPGSRQRRPSCWVRPEQFAPPGGLMGGA